MRSEVPTLLICARCEGLRTVDASRFEDRFPCWSLCSANRAKKYALVVPALRGSFGASVSCDTAAAIAARIERSRRRRDGLQAQVLLKFGKAPLTTTVAAQRAGVSVNQYFPSKIALLRAALQRHPDEIESALVTACQQQSGKSLESMVAALVTSYLHAKMRGPKTSVVLHSVSSDVDGAQIVRVIAARASRDDLCLWRAPVSAHVRVSGLVPHFEARASSACRLSRDAGIQRAVTAILPWRAAHHLLEGQAEGAFRCIAERLSDGQNRIGRMHQLVCCA